MEHTSYINKIKVTFVLAPGKAVDATLSEERKVKIHPPSKACSSVNTSLKDGHIESRYSVTTADSCSKIYNCCGQQPVFLPGCPV